MPIFLGDLILAGVAVWVAAALTGVESWLVPILLMAAIPPAFGILRLYRPGPPLHPVHRVLQVGSAVLLATLLGVVGAAASGAVLEEIGATLVTELADLRERLQAGGFG